MRDALDTITTWLVAHDRQIDLVAIWALAIGFGIFAAVKIVLWLALRLQQDRTAVGRALKAQKASEAVLGLAMSALYGLTLYGYYSGFRFGIWERLALRVVVVIGIVSASLFGLRFVRAYRQEQWGQPETAARQAATEVRQDAREVAQNARDDDWEASHD